MGLSFRQLRAHIFFMGSILFLSLLVFGWKQFNFIPEQDWKVIVKELPGEMESNKSDKSEVTHIPLHSFNPNTISHEELMAMGVPAGLSQTWINYREAGAVFRFREDLKKIYGMNDSIYDHLFRFIIISPIKERASEISEAKSSHPATSTANPLSTKVERKIESKDLNQVDSVDLKKIYGIGPVLSRRIVKYRNLLGGYTAWSQLKEVYGLSSEVVDRMKNRYFIAADYTPAQLLINSDSIGRLASHPYISYSMARVIVAYREQHGNFKTIDDLRPVQILSDSLIERISPYIKF